jgi:hypothetical protein
MQRPPVETVWHQPRGDGYISECVWRPYAEETARPDHTAALGEEEFGVDDMLDNVIAEAKINGSIGYGPRRTFDYPEFICSGVDVGTPIYVDSNDGAALAAE